jgi:RNA polymerase-binding transcription factor DksA
VAELEEALARLERAVTRLETALRQAEAQYEASAAGGDADRPDDEQMRELTAEIVARVDAALEKIGRVLGNED